MKYVKREGEALGTISFSYTLDSFSLVLHTRQFAKGMHRKTFQKADNLQIDLQI